MLETLINPKKAERKSWELLLIGLLYSIISVLIADIIFVKDPVFVKHLDILIITFTTMFSIPFMYYLIKYEEAKDLQIKQEKKLLREHGKALLALLFLFLGYVIAFALIYMIFPQHITETNFKIQVETYCAINSGSVHCLDKQGLINYKPRIEASASIDAKMTTLASILSNNFQVLIISLFFSFVFGAGAIFILAWNASVIGAAIGIFAKHPAFLYKGLLRYMIHGIPEIAAYFIVALAGGIIGIAVIRHEFNTEKFWSTLRDSLDLIILALLILVAAGFIEVFITPLFLKKKVKKAKKVTEKIKRVQKK